MRLLFYLINKGTQHSIILFLILSLIFSLTLPYPLFFTLDPFHCLSFSLSFFPSFYISFHSSAVLYSSLFSITFPTYSRSLCPELFLSLTSPDLAFSSIVSLVFHFSLSHLGCLSSHCISLSSLVTRSSILP